jgi:hypothetical protein
MQRSDIEIPPYVAERPPRPGPDPAIKRMIIAAGAIAAVLIAVTLIWGGIHPRFGKPPTITAPGGPMRTAPADPGGLQVPGAQQQIMSGVAPSGPPKLGPGAEMPDFAKLDTAVAAARRKRQASEPPAARNAVQAASAARPSAAAPSSLAEDAAATLPLPPPMPPSVAPGAAATASPPAVAASSGAESVPVAASAAGHVVQLAALTSAQGAKTAWQRLAARQPDLVAGHTPTIVPGPVNGTMFYRLRIGGFSNDQAARDFCARAKAKGVSCYVPR